MLEKNKNSPYRSSYSSKDDHNVIILDEKFKSIKSEKKKNIAITLQGSSNNFFIEVNPEYKKIEIIIMQSLEKRTKKSLKLNVQQQNQFIHANKTDSRRIELLKELNKKLFV